MCSGWLRQIEPDLENPCVPVWLKKGTMTFPDEKPLIMVGPGTGIAAFRSVVQERCGKGQKLVLVFGCRSKDDDNYYAEELEQMIGAGANLTVITAFSRENPTEGKVYV